MNNEPLENILLRVPDDHIIPEVKQRLGRLLREADQLGRLDQATQQVSIDEASLHRLASEFISPQFADRYIAHLKMLPDSKLTSDTASAQRHAPISWLTLTTRTGVFKPVADPVAALAGLAIGPSSTAQEIRQAVQTRFPEIPDFMFDPAALKRQMDTIVNALTGATGEASVAPMADWNSIFACCERHLPWWLIACAIVLIGAALVALTMATGPGGVIAWSVFWAWFIPLAGSGVAGATLAVVGNCALNPFS